MRHTKILWDFEIQTTRCYINQQKKRKNENLQKCGFCCPVRPQSKIESEKKDMHLDLPRELKNRDTWKWRLYQL